MDHMKSSFSPINVDTVCLNREVDIIPADQFSQNKRSDDESALNDDVKVCDICGVAGYEHSLAVCSKCKDGAEHIYCMRIMMDKLPDSNWMCEECVLEEKDKMKSAKSVQSVTYEWQKSITQPNQGGEISKYLGQKIPTQINSKGLGANISKAEKASVISSNQIPTLMRKRTEETKFGLPSHSLDSATKLSHELSSGSRSIQANAAVPSLSGNLSKSKSFNGSDKRPKVLRLDEVPQNELSYGTCGRKKFSALSSLRKTASFNDASSGRPTASSPKFPSAVPKPFGDGDLKRSWITKDHDSNETKLARRARGPDNPSQNSQALASSDGSEKLTPKGGTSNVFSELKAPPSSSIAIQEDKSASQPGSSGQTEKSLSASTTNPRSTSNMQEGGSQETHLRLMDLNYTHYKQLATFAFPDLNYIWKGQFEIHQSEKLPRVVYRIQAHLSTQASLSIPEAVRKFSNKISLEEVSRMNAWPTQFQERHPQDDSIALYFFAEDNASYGNYRSLLHSMADHDLALRGNIRGIEVLIFPSSLLPEGSQYWNGLLFLWGVFRYRKVVKSQIADLSFR